MPFILVVDDTKAIADVMGKLIAHEGYEVAVAYSGDEALTICEDRVVDLVITDFYMPMGGLEMIVELKERQAEPFATILISGSGIVDNPALISAQKELGIQATFAKPVDHSALREKVRELLS